MQLRYEDKESSVMVVRDDTTNFNKVKDKVFQLKVFSVDYFHNQRSKLVQKLDKGGTRCQK